MKVRNARLVAQLLSYFLICSLSAYMGYGVNTWGFWAVFGVFALHGAFSYAFGRVEQQYGDDADLF